MAEIETTNTLRPLGNRVLIEPGEQKEQLYKGIILSASAGNVSYAVGKILALGSQVTHVKKGDIVAHLKYGYDEMTINNKKLLMVEEGNIIGVFE